MDRIDLNLPLERPLVFFDLETTGTDVAKDRIVEMAFVKVMPTVSGMCVRTRPTGRSGC